MKTLLTRTLAFCFGVAAVLLLLEGVIRVLPVIEGTYAAHPRMHWPVHTMIPDSEYTSSTSWNLRNVQRGRINNYGYASPHDYQPDPDGERGEVAVFGDSYLESLMNPYRDTLSGRVNEHLASPRTVLNFGMSGAELPDYLGTAELVGREFSPEWAVFLITAGDFTRGFNAAPGYYEWDLKHSPPIRLVPELQRSTLSKYLRTVGLVRYLRGNLIFRPGEFLKFQRGADHVAGKVTCRDGILSKQDEQLVDAFVAGLPAALRLPPARLIVVFDADRKAIYAGQTPGCQTREQLAQQRLAQQLESAGIHVINSEPIFRRHFQSGLGPLDRAPLDAHWNPAAHRLIAAEVAAVIEP